MKLLACDLDGTLVKHNDGPNAQRSILKEDKSAVEQFMNDGHVYVVSTGRHYLSTKQTFEKSEIKLKNAYFITSNGAEIYDMQGQSLYKKTLDKNTIIHSLELFERYNTDHNLEYNLFDGQKNHILRTNKDVAHFDVPEEAIDVCIFSRNNQIKDVEPILKEAKESMVNANVMLNNWFLDIVPQDISKASAIEFVVDYVSKDNEIIVGAVGDSWNDMPMFSVADYSYTFNNSPQEVKEAADINIDHLYQCIDDFLKR